MPPRESPSNQNQSGKPEPKTPLGGDNQQVPQRAGNPRFNNPGLDPSTDPKIVVKAVNPPVTPDQVVGMAEMPSAATLDLPRIQNIKIPPVKNKTIQGHLKAIEAKMTATEKLMKDVVKLQKLQIITEKELFERKRELYQNTFEEYLLDKTVDFGDRDAPGGANAIKKGPGGFGFPFGGGRRRKKGRPPGGGSGAGAAATAGAGAATTAAERMAQGQASGLPNLGTDYKKQEQDAIKKAEEFRRQQEQKTKVRPKGSPPLKEGEEEAAEPKTPVLPEQDPAFVPAPIKPPTPNQDPADIETDIEALKYLYEQQPTFTGGLVGNMIPPNTMVHERADGYMVLVSPHARQNAEAPNPFVNGGKVRVLPPTVTVLRPEDVAALQSSDAAKAANALQLYMAVQDVLAAMYGLKTRSGRTPKAGTVPYGRVSQPRMRDAINTIKRRRTNATPVAPVGDNVVSLFPNKISPGPSNPTALPKTPVTAKGAGLGGSKQIMRRSRSNPANPKEDQLQVDRDIVEAEILGQDPAFVRMLMDQGFNFSTGADVMPRTKKIFQSKRQPGVSFETNMDISDFLGAGGGFGPRPLSTKEILQQMKQSSFDQYSSPIGPMPKASGGMGDVDLFNSDALNYFRGMSSKIVPMADGGLVGWWNKGRNMRVPSENTASWKDLMKDDAKQITRTNKAFKSGATGIKGWNPIKAFTPEMVRTGPTPAVRQAFERPARTVTHPLMMALEFIVNDLLLNPRSTAVYDQVTGPNAYYNDPAYKGPMPSQNLENAQSTMMSGSDPKVEIKPLPPDYIKIPGKKKAPDFVGDNSPDIFMRTSIFTRNSTDLD